MLQIHKAAGIIIKDRRLLVTRSKGKTVFVAPGGAVESGETVKQALIRELKEELHICVVEEDLESFGTFHAKAAGTRDKFLRMEVFKVQKWRENISPNSEVEEIFWLSSHVPENMQVGSIFEHEVLPKLTRAGIID